MPQDVGAAGVRAGQHQFEQIYLAVLSLLLVLPLAWGHRFPSQHLLTDLASQLSGHAAYTRHDLHRSRAPT
ncbi:MAG: hypothetical protein ABIQ36_10885 [Rhodanobacter sp.]